MALKLRTPDGARSVVFMHVQKTGGTWVRAVLRDAGLAQGEIGHKHTQLARVREREPDAFVFGFVREPFDFLRSYFLHRHRRGRWVDREFDNACRARSFRTFLEKYLRRQPGWVGEWYELYVGTADYVGRTERLRMDLGVALGRAGLEIDAAVLDGVARQNVTPPSSLPVADLGKRERYYRAAVLEAEAMAYARWYPEVVKARCRRPRRSSR